MVSAGDDVAVHLAAVAVAQDGHVEQAERILLRIFYFVGEQDRAGTGAENGRPVGGEFPNRLSRPSSCSTCSCVVLSPPGRIMPSQPSRSAGVRTSTVSAPRSASI